MYIGLTEIILRKRKKKDRKTERQKPIFSCKKINSYLENKLSKSIVHWPLRINNPLGHPATPTIK